MAVEEVAEGPFASSCRVEPYREAAAAVVKEAPFPTSSLGDPVVTYERPKAAVEAEVEEADRPPSSPSLKTQKAGLASASTSRRRTSRPPSWMMAEAAAEGATLSPWPPYPMNSDGSAVLWSAFHQHPRASPVSGSLPYKMVN